MEESTLWWPTDKEREEMEEDRVSQNNTRTARPRPRPRPIFFWSQTGLVLRPTVSDDITAEYTGRTKKVAPTISC